MNGAYTVLLAEDDSNDVLLTQRAFQKAGIANPLRVVTNGEEAVAYLSSESPYGDRQKHPLPALLLLDLKLPRKSGLEVLEWLRGQPGLKRLPVVMLTSSKETSDVNRAYDIGANSYLVKPVLFDSLLGMVKSLGLYWLTLNKGPEIPDERA